MDEVALRRSIIEHCLEMNASGLNAGTSGNISVRWGDGLLVTPTGIPYRDLAPGDLPFMRFDGTWQGPLAPSSEWRFHLDILRNRPEVNAVVHTHPPYSTALAIKHLEIPALHYMIAAAGGNSIRCARYETYGTAALSEAVLEALEGRKACLMANHGMIATGPSLDRAMWLAVEVETLARQYVLTLQLGGPILLDDAEIDRVVEKFKGYGMRSKAAPDLPLSVPGATTVGSATSAAGISPPDRRSCKAHRRR
ncbi:MAG TPA: class II aldolase/adducin family protein [Stellaceae bacterium]|nr:class II aldolase/adducin family protein [Stellaceae bacterium]